MYKNNPQTKSLAKDYWDPTTEAVDSIEDSIMLFGQY